MTAEPVSLAEKRKQRASRVIRLWHAVRKASCAMTGSSFKQVSTYEQFSAGLLQPDRVAMAKQELIRRLIQGALKCHSPAALLAMTDDEDDEGTGTCLIKRVAELGLLSLEKRRPKGILSMWTNS